MPIECIECRISKLRTSDVLQNVTINVTNFFARTPATQLTISEISIVHPVSKHLHKLLFSNTVKPPFSGPPIKRTLSWVPKRTCDISLYNEPLFSGHLY